MLPWLVAKLNLEDGLASGKFSLLVKLSYFFSRQSCLSGLSKADSWTTCWSSSRCKFYLRLYCEIYSLESLPSGYVEGQESQVYLYGRLVFTGFPLGLKYSKWWLKFAPDEQFLRSLDWCFFGPELQFNELSSVALECSFFKGCVADISSMYFLRPYLSSCHFALYVLFLVSLSSAISRSVLSFLLPLLPLSLPSCLLPPIAATCEFDCEDEPRTDPVCFGSSSSSPTPPYGRFAWRRHYDLVRRIIPPDHEFLFLFWFSQTFRGIPSNCRHSSNRSRMTNSARDRRLCILALLTYASPLA